MRAVPQKHLLGLLKCACPGPSCGVAGVGLDQPRIFDQLPGDHGARPWLRSAGLKAPIGGFSS